ETALTGRPPFHACIQLGGGLAADGNHHDTNLPTASGAEWNSAAVRSRAAWETYWNKSGVVLGDDLLERVWYWNMYFFNCAVTPKATCPGLFANGSYRHIGSTWHG